MYSLSWFYLYGVGGLIYVLGAVACIRTDALDMTNPRDRGIFVKVSVALVVFAGVHALFQWTLPFYG